MFGEGPTEVREGYFTDTQRTAFTSQDIRFTTKGDALYAICLAWPDSGKVVINSLGASAPVNISLLGSPKTLSWSRSEAGLIIDVPDRKPCAHAYAFKILLDAH